MFWKTKWLILSPAHGFRFKLVMGTLPTTQRQHCWRPDLFHQPTCLLCHEAPEDSDHVFSCRANALLPPTFAQRFREELEAVLPNKPGDARTLADVLLASGLSLARFRGALTPSLSTMITAIPLSISLSSSCLADLRALFRIAYQDIWKPRCSAVQIAERATGITPSLKRPAPQIVSIRRSCGPWSR